MLNINKSKTKCIIFQGTDKKDIPSSITIGSDSLEIVDSYKYLGHMVEGSLQDRTDVEAKLRKFYSSTNSVLRNFEFLNRDTLLS